MVNILYHVYSFLWVAVTPLVVAMMQWRKLTGKELPDRFQEKYGLATKQRPLGPLLWIHGASVGESLAALPLIAYLERRHPKLSILMTSGTVSSANLLSKRLPPRVIHQFVPLDKGKYVSRFLNHWRPDLVFWLESEFWPGKLFSLKKRQIPTVLVNARLSPKASATWSRFPTIAAKILSSFSRILCATQGTTDALKKLGAKNVQTIGNLKYAGGPLPVDEDALSQMHVCLRGRPHIVMASSHPGEEELMARVHLRLLNRLPGMLTIIVPRHPERGEAIATHLSDMGLRVARRSLGQEPGKETDIYIADTLGELGVFFRLTTVVIMGGSFADIGGHNPLEPAYFGASLVWGPHMFNFPEIEDAFLQAGAALKVADEEELTQALSDLLGHKEKMVAMGVQAKRVLKEHHQVLDKTIQALEPHIQECFRSNNILPLDRAQDHGTA